MKNPSAIVLPAVLTAALDLAGATAGTENKSTAAAEEPGAETRTAPAETAGEAEKDPRAARIQQWFDRLAVDLELTKEQRPQVAEILQSHMQRVRGTIEKYQHQGMRGRRKAFRELRGHRSELDKQLEAVLTESQLDTFEAYRQELRQQFQTRREQGAEKGLPEDFRFQE